VPDCWQEGKWLNAEGMNWDGIDSWRVHFSENSQKVRLWSRRWSHSVGNGEFLVVMLAKLNCHDVSNNTARSTMPVPW
jgi:hypothetical protein